MRIVLDTNVWLDWLVFDDPGAAFLKTGFAQGRFEIAIDEACEAEFVRVLGYSFGKHAIDAPACLARLHGIARHFEKKEFTGAEILLPKCRDPDDQKFLELALAAGAEYLVTKDRALLDLDRRLKKRSGHGPEFRIVNPADFVTECNSRG